MTTKGISLTGPIGLIYSNKVIGQLDRGLTEFINEMTQLGLAGTLPARLEKTAEGGRLIVHTRRHVAWLYPTQAQDAYRLGHAARRKFRDEERLLKGALLVHCPGGFRPFPDLKTFNQVSAQQRLPKSAYWQQLWQAWQQLPATTTQQEAALPPGHEHYLDLLSNVVEASRQIEITKQGSAPPLHYVSHTDALEQRYSARGVYRFQLARRSDLARNAMVCLGERPDYRGRVIRAEGTDVTVRFEPGVDFAQIKNQGTLRLLPSDRVHRAQRDAINALRTGEARNPRLLANLVEADFLPYRPATDIEPQVSLDPGQRGAFQRAIAVPDLLNVLGPPGTGKTTTITQVVLACVKLGQRVLVTSHTNRAVDNVLEKLPPHINVVRIGNEDSMTDGVKALASESRVEAVRKDILAETALLDRLTDFERQRPLLGQYLPYLLTRVDAARSARSQLDTAEAALVDAVRLANAHLRSRLDDVDRALSQHRAKVASIEVALEDTKRRWHSAEAKAAASLLAFVYRWLANRHRTRLQVLETSLPTARAALAEAVNAHTTLWAQANATAASDPQVRLLNQTRDTARADLTTAQGDMVRTRDTIRSMLRNVIPVPSNDLSTWDEWREFHRWAEATTTMLGRRLELLKEWRDRIGDLAVDLEREIARYADVVGATCIGTDTSALIADLEFDLAIVDEAGQISTPNLLVPLVRSKRAMLVGDHQQLPPFLDEEIRAWADGLKDDQSLSGQAAAEIIELLRKSGFELLFPRAGGANAVWLTTQRRMPIQLARFVSQTFYHSRLDTEHQGNQPDLIFGSPFAMVDTSDQPSDKRFETNIRQMTQSLRHGYRNDLEADLIAQLLSLYHKHYPNWAVIVPFNGQKDLITDRLSNTLGTARAVIGNVGTVDSFQGGERDLIVFGFTRSNKDGNVGFLKELRRFNVAITRARRQLVMVGDMSTLLMARDKDFRALMQSMKQYLAGNGDLRPSQKVLAELGNLSRRAL